MTVPHAANDAVRPGRRGLGLIASALLGLAWGFAWAADSPSWLAAVLGVATLAALWGTLRPRDGWRLIGPHFYFDLIRMARKGRTTVLRVLFLLALLGGIGYIYREYGLMQQTAPGGENPGPTRLEVLSHFNASCVYTWFLVQNLAILVLAPAYVGGAIAEERESRALDLLFTTALYDREIVLGKFAARVLHLGGLLLAGLPIFSMMQVWGGVDLTMLLGNWINSVLLLLTVSSICMAHSTMPTSATSAVIASYCVVAPVGFCCMAATYPLHVYDSGLRPGYYLLMASLYAGTIAGCLTLSVRSIRRTSHFQRSHSTQFGAR